MGVIVQQKTIPMLENIPESRQNPCAFFLTPQKNNNEQVGGFFQYFKPGT